MLTLLRIVPDSASIISLRRVSTTGVCSWLKNVTVNNLGAITALPVLAHTISSQPLAPTARPTPAHKPKHLDKRDKTKSSHPGPATAREPQERAHGAKRWADKPSPQARCEIGLSLLRGNFLCENCARQCDDVSLGIPDTMNGHKIDSAICLPRRSVRVHEIRPTAPRTPVRQGHGVHICSHNLCTG